VVCDVTIVKQKRQACAAFLGVLTISINVLRVCCILTTIFGVLAPLRRHREPEKATPASTEGRSSANQLPRENTAPIASETVTKKAAAVDAAAFPKRCSRQATV